MSQAYGIRTTVKGSYEETIPRVTDALKQEGFGILTQIDVKDTLKKKLNVDFPKYMILGACNPPLAHKALSAETEIGLLLPCNVIVYEGKDGRTVVAAQDPDMAEALRSPDVAGFAKYRDLFFAGDRD